MLPVKNQMSLAERKKELRAEADFYKHSIDEQVVQLKSQAVRVSTRSLIIASVLLGTYLLFKLITPKEEEEYEGKIASNPNAPIVINATENTDSWLVKSIKGYMLSFLVGIARNKIMAAIAMLKDSNAK